MVADLWILIKHADISGGGNRLGEEKANAFWPRSRNFHNIVDKLSMV